MTTTDVGARITLSLLEFDVLWEHLRLGLFPPVLDFDPHGATLDERADLRTRAWTSLTGKSLGRPEEPDDRLTTWLHRLARSTWELDARLHLSTGPRTSALLAWHDKWATVAVLDGAGVTLQAVRADQVTRSAVALLPAHPAGTGSSITLPTTTLDAAERTGRGAGFHRSLVSQGLGKAEARKITEVFTDVVRFGQFGATYTPADVRHRAGHVVSIYDCPHGRYLFNRKQGWATLTPGANAAIERQLGELLTELSPIEGQAMTDPENPLGPGDGTDPNRPRR